MKKTMRRIVSIVLALAMVITSMSYTPKTVSADDYSSLKYTTVNVTMDSTYGYSILSNTLTDFSHLNFYGTNYMQVVGSGNSKLNETTMTVSNSSGTDVTDKLTWSDKAAAIYGIMVSQLDDNDYYYFKFTGSTGTLEFVLKKGTPSGGGSVVEPETTTSAPFEEGKELLKDFTKWNTLPAGAIATSSSITASIPGYKTGNNYASQAVYNGITLIQGKWYKATVTLTASVARSFQLYIQSDQNDGGNWSVINTDDNKGTFTVEANKPYTYTTIFQANSVANNYLFEIMMGFVNSESDKCDVTVTNASLTQWSTKPSAGSSSAFEKVEAEDFVSEKSNNVSKDTNENLSGGGNLGGCYNGRYAGYTLNFDKIATGLSINYVAPASESAGGSIEVYVDGMESANKVGTIGLPQTDTDDKGWTNGTYKTVSGLLDKPIAEGEHDVYLKFVAAGYVANIDYFQFTTLTAPSAVRLYNLTDAAQGYKVVITDANTYPEGVTPSYQIFINNGATPVTTVTNGETISAETVSALGLTSDAHYNVTAKAVATIDDVEVVSPATEASTFYYTTGTASQNTDIAEIYINTSRNSGNSSLNIFTDTTKAKVDAGITVKKADGTVEAYDYGTTNVRGNSTLTAAKKAYNIKFNSKHNLFEMGSAKKWSLLANAFDRSLIRNQIALDFQRGLEESQANGNIFTSNSRPVELYIDGKYLGSYSLVESVETGTDRVNINDGYTYGKDATEDVDIDDVKDETAKTSVTIGEKTYNLYDMLLELANDTVTVSERMEEEAYYLDTTYERFALNSPERSEGTSYGYKPDETRPAYVTGVEAYLEAFEAALDANDYDTISQFIDVESFVDFYITAELFMVKDINFSSTRFYIKSGKLYAGPLWDADLSAGNIVGDEGAGYDKIYAQNFVWFAKLMANTTFAKKVKNRYLELQPTITALYATNGTIDTFAASINKSAVANFEEAYKASDGTTNGWGYTFVDQSAYGRYGSATTFDNYQGYVNEFKTWLSNRNTYLLKTWSIEEEYEGQEAIDPGTITDWVYFDDRNNKSYTSIYGTEFFVSESQRETISTKDEQTGLYDGVNTKPDYHYKDTIIDGQPVMSWVCGNNVTDVVINGIKYGIDTTNVFFEYDCVSINQKLFKLPEGVYVKYYTISLLKSDGTEVKFLLKVSKNPGSFSVNDYSSYTGKYICKFNPIEEAETYKLIVDGNETSITVKGSGDFFTVSQLSEAGISSGNHSVSLVGVDSVDNRTEASKTVEINVPETAGNNNDIAQIYIQTDDTKYTPTAADEKTLIEKPVGKLQSVITVFDQTGTFKTVYEDVDKTTVKVRGNSTANAEKKAYNITFNKKKNLFNLGGEAGEGAKKWSLLANAFDKSLVRNKIGMDLGYSAGLEFNSRSRYVDLYFNGVYLGNYLLIESVETGSDRVDIDSENGTNYNTDALLELEMIHALEDGVLNFKSSIYNQTFIFGSPETADDIDEKDSEGNPIMTEAGNTFSQQKVIDTKAFIDRFETDLSNADYASYSQYVDIESFVQFYLVNELFQTKDIAQSSTRFYISNGKLYAGPMWDLDLSSGNVEGQSATQWIATEMPWFRELMKDTNFKNQVIAKYRAMHSQIVGLYIDGGNIDQTVEEISGSAARNYADISSGGAGWAINGRQTGDGWSNSNKWTSYGATIEAFKEHLEARVAFLDEQWDVNYNATISTEGDVVVSWDAIEGATAYKLSFRGKAASVEQTSEYNYFDEELNELLTVSTFGINVMADEGASEYSDQVVYVTDATSYNFTQVGYELEPNSTVTVDYTTDSIDTSDSTAVAAATYQLLDVVNYQEQTGELEAPDGLTWVVIKDITTDSDSNYYYATNANVSDIYANATNLHFVFTTGLTSATIGDTALTTDGAGLFVPVSNIASAETLYTVTAVGGETYTVYIKKSTSGSSSSAGTINLTTRWEQKRNCTASWSAVDGATSYAVYADGKLVAATTELTMDINAFSFASATNSNGDATTVGDHTIYVKALTTGEVAPTTLEEANATYKKDFSLYENYVYGNLTKIWNNTGIDSVWNFTLCESNLASKITTGSDVDVTYNNDATASITINSVGQHATFTDEMKEAYKTAIAGGTTSATGDQAWTVKAAIYDQVVPGYQQILDSDDEATKAAKAANNKVNLSFTITGPACLVGQEIQIKCVPEEVDDNGNYYNVDTYGYKEAKYKFEEKTVKGEKVAVLSYSLDFTATKADYDLLFGLGLLDPVILNVGNPIDLEFSDATIKNDTIYSVQTITAESSAVSIANATWTTNMPESISDTEKARYSYNLYVDGELTAANTGLKVLTKTLENLSGGAHTLLVESIYDSSANVDGSSTVSTGRVSTTVDVISKPDLVISDVQVSAPSEFGYRVGDTIEITVTMKNVGDTDAVAADGTLAFRVLKGTNLNDLLEIGYRSDFDTLSAGASMTKTQQYTLTASDVGTLYVGGRADTGDDIAEENEDNNLNTISIDVLASFTELTLANDGTDVKATWDAVENATSYTIKYTSAGETVTVENITSTEYTFPTTAYADNNTKVTVYATVGEETYAVYQSVALADLVMDSIGTAGNVKVGQSATITAVVKNVGTARATATDQNLYVIVKDAANENNVGYSSTTDILAPNATKSFSIGGYTATVAGTETLNYIIDDVNRIAESNTDNNKGTFDVTAEEEKESETTTEAPEVNWVKIGSGVNDGFDYYYKDNTTATIVNVQTAGEYTGIYANVPAGINSVSVNGSTENVAHIDGAGTWIFLPDLVEYDESGNINTVIITYDGTKTATIEIKKVPSAETPVQTFTPKRRWEAKRAEYFTWTKSTKDDKTATGYTVYVDGVLYDTIEAGTNDSFNYELPAYAFAQVNPDNKNAQGQPTTVGKHKVTIAALYDGAAAPTTEPTEDIVGTDDPELFVNYVYGNTTNLWTGDGISSMWNYTLCESNEAGSNITTGADVKVTYVDDGAARLQFYNMGLHGSCSAENKASYDALTSAEARIEALDGDGTDDIAVGDQAWTIKAAIYDGTTKTGDNLNLSFDIIGPAALVGQVIKIKCVPEEVDGNDVYYSVEEYGYEEKYYTFAPVYVKDAEGNDTNEIDYSVLHYSNTFVATNDTYDLLFGLGLLNLSDGETLEFTDPSVTKLYGVTSVTADANYSHSNDAENPYTGIFASFTSNVPSHLAPYCTYNAYVYDSEGTLIETINNTKVGTIPFTNLKDGVNTGFTTGTYTVKVESVYNGTVTATKEDTVTVGVATGPDLVITDIVISDSPNTDGTFKVGDTVTISYKMVNIGNETATPNPSTAPLNTNSYVSINGADFVYNQWNRNDSTAIEPGVANAYNGQYTYTFTEAGDVVYRIKADAGLNVTELSEDNNTTDVSFYVYDRLETLNLENDGENVFASWPKPTNGETDDYIIEYTSTDGTTHSATVKYNESLDTYNYVFPEGQYPAYQSDVILSVLKSDGTKLNVAKAIAKPDMVISSISVPKRIYSVGETVVITSKMKNVGTSDAYTIDNIVQKRKLNGNLINDYSQIGIHNWSIFEEKVHTYNYIIQEGDVQEDGTLKISTFADADGVVVELDENNNNSEVITLAIVDGANLVLNNVDTNDDGLGEGTITATWPGNSIIKGFEIIYKTGAIYELDGEISTQITRTLFVDTSNYIEDTNGNYVYTVNRGTLVYNPVTNLYTYTFNELLDNNSTVEVRAAYIDNPSSAADFSEYVSATALADLIITDVTDSVNGKVRTKIPFTMDISIYNNGTARIPAAPNEFPTYYGGWIISSLQPQTDVEEKVGNEHGAVVFTGMVPGQSEVVTLNDALITGGTKEGKQYDLVLKVDDPGHVYSDATGYIRESNEDNNTFVHTVTATYNQEKMDWTPLIYDNEEYVNDGKEKTDPYTFSVGGGSYTSNIEYKILDTNISDLDYEDIMTKYGGYNSAYMALGLTNQYVLFDTNNTNHTTHGIVKYAQAKREYCNDYDTYSGVDDMKPNYTVLSSNAYDVIDAEGQLVQEKGTTTPSITYDGNGWQFPVGSWGVGKYYTFYIYNYETGKYVEVAFRVVGETGDLIQAYGSGNTDATHVPAYYHDKTYETNGTIFYDAKDLGLSSCVVYNGNHLAVHIDNSLGADLTDVSTWKMGISYASVDNNGNFVVPDTSDPNYEEVLITPVNGGILGYNSSTTALMMFPNVIEDLPVHSDRVDKYGNPIEVDSQYYYMKIYYDISDMNKYVAIPIKFEANIPEIEEIHGLAVSGRGDTLSVSWYNTSTQDLHSYGYDVYVDGEKKLSSVKAGSYNFSGYDVQTVGTVHTVKVVGRWGDHCQETVKVFTYEVESIDNQRTYITDEFFDYNTLGNDKWVPLKGEQILPIRLEGTVSETVNAEIYYYTDDTAQFDAVGYNGYYISLSGDKEYYSGSNSSLYVRNGDSYRFGSRNIYDNFYQTKILMNASELFETYGGYKDNYDMYNQTFYYTVRVYGNNGSSYRDFYFKVVPTKQATGVSKVTGEWRHIDGEYNLPVKFDDLTLDGEIFFYDYPSQTKTYNVTGYNGYYMSLIGDNTYYKGGTTTMEVSKPISKEMAADFDKQKDGDENHFHTETYIDMAKNGTLYTVYGNNTYTEDADIYTSKNIYDSVYNGFMNINAADTFTVSYGTNYYIVKITDGDSNVTYLPVKIVVGSGDVEVQGFQVNYDKGTGSASEFNPSCRVVSRASKVMSIKDKLYRVKTHGTVYGVTAKITNDQMTVDSDSKYVSHMQTNVGLYQNYESGRSDDQYYNYYAFTIRWVSYNFEALNTEYSYRAYAVIDDGTAEGKVVYGKKVYAMSIYNVAKYLYDNCRIYTKDGHEFLYRDIVNLVTMDANRSKISNAMAKALGVTSTSSNDYKLINAAYKDILYYTRCTYGYDYANRGDFTCKLSTNHSAEVISILSGLGYEVTEANAGEVLETALLAKLNTAKGTNYTTLSDWIYNETSNYHNSSNVYYEGFYRKVDFDWNSSILKEFDSE